MFTASLRSKFAHPRFALALPLSIALHLVLVYAVTRSEWSVPEVRSRSELTVVWLSDWQPAERTEEAVPEPEQPPQIAEPPRSPVDAPTDPAEESKATIESPTRAIDVDETATDEAIPELELQADRPEDARDHRISRPGRPDSRRCRLHRARPRAGRRAPAI